MNRPPVKPPHPGGRPALPRDRRRLAKSLVSFTVDEWERIERRAEAVGMSPAVYLRHAGLGVSLASRIDRRALAQLARAGNLLNQAVRYSHQTQRPADVEHAIVSAALAIEKATRELLP